MRGIIDRLKTAFQDENLLKNFLLNNNNSIELQDFFNQPYKSLLDFEGEYQKLILPNYSVIVALDSSEDNHVAFILHLLAFSERFGLLAEFEQLYGLCRRKGISPTNRLKAAAKNLIGIRKVSDYKNRLPEVASLLRLAILEEEDAPEQSEVTFINGYLQIAYDNYEHNRSSVLEYQKASQEIIQQKEYSFLNTAFVSTVLSIVAGSRLELYEKIQALKDELLSRNVVYSPRTIHEPLLEQNSVYTKGIDKIPASFAGLVAYCKDTYKKIQDDSFFYSLNRGVAVLTREEQLLAYMYSYGNMHHQKMLSGLINLENNSRYNNQRGEVYDWGCGQGLASVILLERLTSLTPEITLIEPSEIALKRAAFHVNWMRAQSFIETIQKDIDSLVSEDFQSDPDKVKIHLFSNILDVPFFNLEQLTNLITKSFKGVNYFVCVSPYIDVARANRLNNFVEAFTEYTDFSTIVAEDKPKRYWIKNWSKCVRVFSVTIN